MLFFFSFLACQDQNTTSETPKTKAPPMGAPKAEAPKVASKCSYTVKEAKPEWTAYKYTEKSAVEGTFNTFTLSTPKTTDSFASSLEGLSIEIDASSVESKNPERNKTIAEKYFALFAPQSAIKGNVVSAKGDEEKGSIDINIDMNGMQKTYTFAYEQKEGTVVASSVMDMMDFQLQKPFDSIHESCKTLHTGTDGVAKTWTEVALRVVVRYDKACK